MRPLLACLAALLLVPATAAAQQPMEPALPDAVFSDNVQYLGSFKQDVGLTTSAKVVGDRLFVSGGKNLAVYDISTPAAPKPMGVLKANLAWQNEEVPTNGKVLGFASDTYNGEETCVRAGRPTGCIQFFDVRDPANIKIAAIIPSASHTVECALDCQYFYGSNGQIIDARGVLDGKAPKVIGNWKTALREQDTGSAECHHIREIRPGVLLTACRPFAVISINEEDGGTPTRPEVLAKGQAAKFVHSARWPRGGTDDLVLIGGELNFTARCEQNDSEFSTYSAKDVLAGTSTDFTGPLFQKAPVGNGVYADGKAPAGVLGCSVHWFQEHPTWKNGGLVALSEFEHGIRFLQVKPDGSILEQGFFTPLASSSGAPVWAGKDDVIYNIDYQRGIDVLRWKGEYYVPGQAEPEGRVKGTEGDLPDVPPTFAKAMAAVSKARPQPQVPVGKPEGTPFVCRLSGWR